MNHHCHDRWPISLWGSSAAATLAPGVALSTLAVFPHSCYLQATNQSIVCLLDHFNEPGPLHVLCRLPATFTWTTRISPGTKAQMTAAGLLLEGCGFLPTQQSTIWQPTHAPLPRLEDWQTGLINLQICLNEHQSEDRRSAQQAGLGVLIPYLFADTLAAFTSAKPNLNPATAAAALAGVQAIRDWLYSGAVDHWRAPDSVIRLLGLGPGLTPSGDDFLTGLLVGLHSLNRHNSANQLANQLLPEAFAKTNVLSLAYLRCAAVGQASAPLHRLLYALGTNKADLPLALAALLNTGYSSGWDSLTGVILASLAHARQ